MYIWCLYDILVTTYNIVPFIDAGEESPSGCVGGVGVFLVTTQDVSVGDELVFWAHDPTLAWSRKKMEKTSKL